MCSLAVVVTERDRAQGGPAYSRAALCPCADLHDSPDVEQAAKALRALAALEDTLTVEGLDVAVIRFLALAVEQ